MSDRVIEIQLDKCEVECGRGSARLRVYGLPDDGVEALHALHGLAKRWLACAVVAHDHLQPAVPEQPRDGGQRCSAPDQLGGEGVAKGVRMQSGFSQPARPLGEDLRDLIGRELMELCLSLRHDYLLPGRSRHDMHQALDAICRLFTEREDARAGLAADVERLCAQVDILRAQARQLTAAQAGAEQKFKQIRVALRGAESLLYRRRALATNFPHPYVCELAKAMDQIERLLPPEHVGPGIAGSGQSDTRERTGAAPTVASSDAEHPRKEA